jgi:hypothetical protein
VACVEWRGNAPYLSAAVISASAPPDFQIGLEITFVTAPDWW